MGFLPPSQVIRLRETDDMRSAGRRSKGGAMDGAPDRVGSVRAALKIYEKTEIREHSRSILVEDLKIVEDL